jgi:hypothetical protein
MLIDFAYASADRLHGEISHDVTTIVYKLSCILNADRRE